MTYRFVKNLGRSWWLLLAVLGAAIWLVYAPGLRGPFVFDDMVNIVGNSRVALSDLTISQIGAATFANESGPLGRPLSSFTFALNHYFAGGYVNTFAFKLTNLLIHIVNTVLIYWLALALLVKLPKLTSGDERFGSTKLRWLSLFTAAIWALHPIQLTSVLYVVQRMTGLSAIFTLAGLLVFVRGRERLQRGAPKAWALMTAGLAIGLTGILAKENAALILVYALVIEFVLYDRRRLSQSDRRRVFAFYGAAVVAPIVLAIGVATLHFDWLLNSYAARDFTPTERLLTESRVLWHYVRLILLPEPTAFTLFHDDIPLSSELFDPWTTSIAVAAIVLSLAGAVLYRRRFPAFAFVVLWFLAGHSLESSILGLELAHEHRNYLPSFGVILALSYAIGRFHATLKQSTALPFAAVALMLACAIVTTVRANTWSTEERLIETLVRHHPRSERSHAMYAELLGERRGDTLGAIAHYQRAMELAPEEPAYSLRLVLFVGSQFQQSDNSDARNATPIVWRTLGTSLRDRLHVQLATSPFTPESAQLLHALSQCAIRKLGTCHQFASDVIGWHTAIERNTRVAPSIRAALLFDLFELAYTETQYETALRAARQGTTLDPSSIDFLLMQADALLALKRPTDAEQTLGQVEAKAPLDEDRRKSIEIIRDKIRSPRARGAAA